jgi:hypothetical protein
MIEKHKICTKCKISKPFSAFSRDKQRELGIRSQCKQCQNLGNRIRRNGTEEYKIKHYPSDGVTKVCTECLQEQPVRCFSVKRKAKDGLSPSCKSCCSIHSKSWHSKNKGRCYLSSRKAQLKRNFNITVEEYDVIYREHSGECAICGAGSADYAGSKLCVDHDHENGKIRGLLCRRCNAGLGFFNDDPELVKEAAAYMMERR